MSDILYKYQDEDSKLNRNISFLQYRNDQFNNLDSNQIPSDYDINDLKLDLKCLNEGIGNGQIDTVKTNLNNALNFIGQFYDSGYFEDPQGVSKQILEAFIEFGFMENTIEIIRNDTKIQDIIYLFEILIRIFLLIQYVQDEKNEEEVPLTQYLQDQVTNELLLEITNIVLDPKSILSKESTNALEFGQVSLTQLFTTTYDIPIDQYNKIINLGIAAISTLCSDRNDLMEFTYTKICPSIYDSFITNGEAESDTIFEIVKLFGVIITYFNYELLIDDIKPFLALFVLELNVDKETCFLSLQGILQCINRNPGVADEFPKTSLFEQINNLLVKYDEEIQNIVLILITEILCRASKPAKEELARYVKWELIRDICYDQNKIKIRHSLCRAIPKIINHANFIENAIYDSQLIHVIISICINSHFELKKEAFCSFLQIIQFLTTAQISDIMENDELFGGFFKILNEFLIDVDDQTAIDIIHTLTYIFQIGTETNIIKKLNKQIFFKDIEENVELLQNSDNEELSDISSKFIDDLAIYKQELEEALETGED